jgi:hypothetical protein
MSRSSAGPLARKVSSGLGMSPRNRPPRLDGNLVVAAASDVVWKPRRCYASRAGLAGPGATRRARGLLGGEPQLVGAQFSQLATAS